MWWIVTQQIMSTGPRRQFLQLCGAAAVASLAGCAGGDDPAETATPTDTPVDTPGATTEPTTETPTSRATPAAEFVAGDAWAIDRLSGRVDTLLLPEAGPTDEPAGPLYAATEAREVARITAQDGRLKWSLTARGDEERDPDLTVTEEAVYAVSETFTDETLASYVEALEPTTGDVRWTFEEGFFLRVLGVVDDVLVLAGEEIARNPDETGPNRSPRGEGRLYGVDRATGEERWCVGVPELRGADVAGHGVYALERSDRDTNNLRLHAVDPDGTRRWSVDTGTITPLVPLAEEGILLAGAGAEGTERGGVGRYDPADGSLLWTTGDWERGPRDLGLQDGMVHAGTGPFLALDRDGDEQFRVPRFSVPEVPATPETLYNDGGTQVPAVDRASGAVRWRYRPADYQYTHLRAVLADYVAVDRGIGPDRELVVLGEADGELRGTFQTPGTYLGTVGAGNRLFAGVESDVIAYDITDDRA